MCIICRGESLEGLQELHCSYCPQLTSIPVIEGLQELHCHNCPQLTSIPVIEGLRVLDCYKCPLLKSIPVIEGLQRLYCSNCPLLTSIPVIEGLQILNCSYCPQLTSIPVIKELQVLCCYNCPLLTSIPVIKGLKYYYSWLNYGTNYNEALIKLSENDCPWLKPSKEKLNKVITLQKYFKKTIMINSLMKIIPDITEVYYQPGNKGFYLLKQKFDN
jgi:uncharacterized protein involved in tolerance to divalent cations